MAGLSCPCGQRLRVPDGAGGQRFQFHKRQGNGFALLMADASGRTFREDFDAVEMRKVSTRNGGNLIDYHLLEK